MEQAQSAGFKHSGFSSLSQFQVFGFFARESGGKASIQQKIFLAIGAAAILLGMLGIGMSWVQSVPTAALFVAIAPLLMSYRKPFKS
jgi:hypothetical protein